MAADMDVFIRSSEDPLLFLEFHRQFTHSLFFIPIGGLICALLLHLLYSKRNNLKFSTSYAFSTIAYASHGLLDSCTSYGTLLLWPLTDHRFAWDNVSVVDPTFTIPILLLAIFALTKKKPWLARTALVFGLCYLMLGVIQHNRAIDLAEQLAAQRGHVTVRVQAKPSFANLVVWKTIYETQDTFYVDAFRVGNETTFYKGSSTAKLDINRDFPWLDKSVQQAKDIERFRWFSSNYLAVDSNNPNRIIDMRYSLVPNEIQALWSINLSPEADSMQHASYSSHRGDSTKAISTLFDMIRGVHIGQPYSGQQ